MPESRIPRQLVELQRQLVEFQKQTFDSTFTAMSALQDQQRELMSRVLDSAPALPAEMKQLLDEWGDALETGREQFRDTVDRSFETVESYLERLAGDADASGNTGGAAPTETTAKAKSGKRARQE